MSKENKLRIVNNPEVLDEFIKLVESGATQTAIGKHFGVSRDVVRTLIKKYKVKPIQKEEQYQQEDVDLIVKRIIHGEPILDLVKETGFKDRRNFNEFLAKFGYSMQDIKQQRSKHLHDNKVFSYWKVVPGTHGIIEGTTERGVLCRCICGVERAVRLTNLISGASQSCGCIGYNERTNTAWKNADTGEVVPTSKALLNKVSHGILALYRFHTKKVPVVDTDGQLWEPIDTNEFITRGCCWENTVTHQIVFTTKDLADQANVNRHTLYWQFTKAKDRTKYVDKNGDLWILKFRK